MKLFFVISSSGIGGAEGSFATLLKGLSTTGAEIHVAHDGTGPMAAEYRAHVAGRSCVDMSSVFNVAAVTRLSSLMRAANADLVHTHLWNADVLGGLAARRAGIPAVATVYGAYHLPIDVTGVRGIRRRVLSRAWRTIYRGFDRVIAISNYVREDLIGRAGVRVPGDRIEVIYPGFDRSRVVTTTTTGRPARAPRGDRRARLINVANFFPVKGQEWLIRALPRVLARFPGTECVFISDGPTRSAVEGLASDIGVRDHVIFAGGTTTSELLEWMSESDVFVFPSLSEGFGLAILEAWAFGLPVVASRAGAIPEVVEHGRTGLLVPPGDPTALADGINALLSDPVLARRLANAGRDSLRMNFTPEQMVEKTASLYRTLT